MIGGNFFDADWGDDWTAGTGLQDFRIFALTLGEWQEQDFKISGFLRWRLKNGRTRISRFQDFYAVAWERPEQVFKISGLLRCRLGLFALMMKDLGDDPLQAASRDCNGKPARRNEGQLGVKSPTVVEEWEEDDASINKKNGLRLNNPFF